MGSVNSRSVTGWDQSLTSHDVQTSTGQPVTDRTTLVRTPSAVGSHNPVTGPTKRARVTNLTGSSHWQLDGELPLLQHATLRRGKNVLKHPDFDGLGAYSLWALMHHGVTSSDDLIGCHGVCRTPIAWPHVVQHSLCWLPTAELPRFHNRRWP